MPRIYTAAAYERAKANTGSHRAEQISPKVRMDYGTIFSTTRSGRKFASIGWRVHIEGVDGYTYWDRGSDQDQYERAKRYAQTVANKLG
jgi:hypothetical protein